MGWPLTVAATAVPATPTIAVAAAPPKPTVQWVQNFKPTELFDGPGAGVIEGRE